MTTIDTLTEYEARRLGAVAVIEALENPYNSYVQDLGNLHRNSIQEAHERFADRYGWHPDDQDPEEFERLRGAYCEGFDAAIRIAEQASYESRLRGDQGVQDALAFLRERDERNQQIREQGNS